MRTGTQLVKGGLRDRRTFFFHMHDHFTFSLKPSMFSTNEMGQNSYIFLSFIKLSQSQRRSILCERKGIS